MNMEKSNSQEGDAFDDSLPEETRKGRRSFASIRRELSEEELSSPGVQKMLIEDIERLERENFSLSGYRDDYYDAEKKAAILEEKDKSSVAMETMFGVCLTVGGGLLSFAPSESNGWVFASIAVVLIAGGIASKVVKR